MLNCQMAGLLIGGIVFGVVGDKLGRVKVLFASILTYSLANLFNATVRSVGAYAFWRFVAGFGLAGELGAAITLVSETMPKETRGIGTTVVSAFGVLGAVFAALVGSVLPWRLVFVFGGILGLLLLALRVGVLESGMYGKIANSEHIPKGDLRMLFRPKERLVKFIRCVVVGSGNWCALAKNLSPSPHPSSLLANYRRFTPFSAPPGSSPGLLDQLLIPRSPISFVTIVLGTASAC